jgi:hypothetical protein
MSTILQSTKVRWYTLGGFVFLLVFTTCVRSTIYLSNHLDSNRRHDLILPTNHILGDLYPPLVIDPKDYIFLKDSEQWDAAPIVVEEYKLIFFTIPKVACTTWKQLFRRMMGDPDWKSQNATLYMPHNPEVNGLKYLWDYSIDEATELMTNPNYTRAIFVRDPKQRYLSAFLDKVMSNYGEFLTIKCCATTKDCLEKAQTTLGFLKLIHNCSDPHWDAQSYRMEPKYWKYINFVGHVENIQEDGTKLLKRIGAWDDYGAAGWGRNGTSTIFGTAEDQSHSTWSQWRVWQWYTPAIERQVEAFYAADYESPLFQFRISNLTKEFFVKGSDTVYRIGPWDGAPIVVEKYKLIFFSSPKIGGTVWKQALRRMEGHADWKEIGGKKMLPHEPTKNGLKYLYDYNVEEASDMLRSPNWTRAMFVRNPKDRFLSVYAEMSRNPGQVRDQCCRKEPGCETQTRTMLRFLDLMHSCKSAHWDPQSHRMESHYWEYMNFIGQLETVEADSERLLKQIGAWEEVGATGWGPNGGERIFAPDEHAMDSVRYAMAKYTPVVDRLLDEIYKEDYENKLFNFPQKVSALISH